MPPPWRGRRGSRVRSPRALASVMESRSPGRRRLVAALVLGAASVALHLLLVAGLALQGGPRMPERAAAAPRIVDATLLRPPPPPPPPPPAVAAPVAAPPPVAVPAPPAPSTAARPKPAPARKPASPPPQPAPAAAPVAGVLPVPAASPSDFATDTAPVALADTEGSDAASESRMPPAPADAAASGAAPAESAPAESAPATAAEQQPVRQDAAPDAGAPVPATAASDADAAPGPGAAASDADADTAGSPLPAIPGSHSRRFRVYWGDYTEGRSVARLEYRLTVDGDRYEIRTDAEAQGLISLVYSGTLSQVSSGRLGPRGFEPLRYAEQRGKRPERSVAFDQVARQLLPVGRPPVPLPRGTQDRLSVFYQLGLLVRADPGAFTAGSVPEVPVASLRDVAMQRFEVVGDRILMAPGGPIRALHLRRPAPSGSDDPEIDVWLGYDFDMLPVRLRIQDSGSRVLDQLIERDG